MSKLKRRRTSLSEAGPESPREVFELQNVPDHKKRNHKVEFRTVDERKEEEPEGEDHPQPVFLEPPAVILTTPEGLDLDTFAHGLMDIVDVSSSDVDDEWDTLIPPPLVASSPKPPSKRRPPPPPRPQRPADLILDTFVLGPPTVPEHFRDNDSDSDATLVSPFADPEDADGKENTPSSWWSWSSSDASSDTSSSSSSSSDSETDDMDFQYARHMAAKTLYTQITDGFVSFPALSPDGSEDDDDDDDKMAMKSFLNELDPEDMRDAEELLRNNDDGTDELIQAVASVESDWANAFSRPVPRWLWLKSSNSFPVYRLGPNDLRHGHSKLRQAVSLVDDAGGSETGSANSRRSPLDGTVAEVARAGVVYL